MQSVHNAKPPQKKKKKKKKLKDLNHPQKITVHVNPAILAVKLVRDLGSPCKSHGKDMRLQAVKPSGTKMYTPNVTHVYTTIIFGKEGLSYPGLIAA